MEKGLTASQRRVPTEKPPKPQVFTFVPVLQELPIKRLITPEGRAGALRGNSDEETMSDGEVLRAERVFIKDFAERGAGTVIQQDAKPEEKHSTGHVSLSQTKVCPTVGAQSENTPKYAAALTGSMETAVDKHTGISQQQHCHDTFGRAEVSAGCFAHKDRTSLMNCTDLFPTPASSRESVLSDDSDKEKSWPAARLSSLASPVSFSRTVSPCSSTRSGIFSPAVIQIKKHFLAPGSSLVHIPQTCFSSCDSLSSSVCPESPPPRHRPPVTRLSLLTAILRKGRLPVLSSALQRPYTPCWPVNPVTLSFCNACSAASSVASIPLEFSSQFSSSASLNIPRDPNRCVTAPPPVQSYNLSRTCPDSLVSKCSRDICSSTVPRWEEVVSPPPAKNNTTFKSVPPPKHEEITDCDSKTLQNTHVSISTSPELKPSHTHMNIKGHEHNNLKNRINLSTKTVNEDDISAPRKASRPLNSSLSQLRFLSQRLRSPPVCPPQLQPSLSRSPGVTVSSARTDTASRLPAFYATAGSCGSDRSCPDTKSAKPSHGFHSVHCLSPSRYTPIAFSGWPSPVSSPTPTPSPAPPIRVLTPSPSLSLCTTPSPRPGSGISDCSDREGKKRKTHKIKLGYKSLAAIPTNTLLLDQQAIDEQVERAASPGEMLERGLTPDPHAEMCSPAQLRQQSEELYAVIDEVLANSAPPVESKQTFRSSTGADLQQNTLSLPKSLGRETKYASVCSLHPSAHIERKKDPKPTRPGVIRPMTAIPRLTVPFRLVKTLTDHRKVDNVESEEFFARANGQTLREERRSERKSPFSSCDLYITEPEDQRSHPVKDASTSFSPTKWQMEAFQTHI